MVNVRARRDTGKLFFDFYYEGKRCREYTDLTDTVENRRKMKRVAKKIDKEMKKGTFEYGHYFPNSKSLKHFEPIVPAMAPAELHPVSVAVQTAMLPPEDLNTPTFRDFSDTWVSENEVGWRRSHKKTVVGIIEGHLKPEFGEKKVSHITKAEIMAFRSTLAKVPGRKAATLSPKRINAIMTPLRQILNEAADRFEFITPYRNIKPLKVPKTDVAPFSLEEVQKILDTVRPDFQSYYTVRFFTGMRTGEIDGLKWQYVDFEHRLILIRETVVDGEEEDNTKTLGSQREIQMSQVVYDALMD